MKGIPLSFGDVIALAADYFYHWKLGPCYPSISDDWDRNPSRSREIAADSVNLLRTDWEGFLEKVLRGIHDQENKVSNAVGKGQDVAQVYKDYASEYDNYFFRSMKGGYLVIALCNPDHFGKDAERAYSSVHDVALALAKDAAKTQDQAMLKDAYFTEAYAQHYLTDMFAAGHLRPPRRVLHSDSFDAIRWMPGDRCTQKQHDEDGANGLWVTNKEGHSWSSYGDKQLAQGRSAKNRQMVRAACQASVDEIWDTFRTRNKPEPESFKALQLTPLPELTFGPTNSVPLFQLSPDDKDVLLYRTNVNARHNSKGLKKLGLKQTNDAFLALQEEIEASGAAVNMYVFTRAFTSEQGFLHLGAFDVTDDKSQTVKVVANLYGQVDAGDQGQNWGMTAQGILELPMPAKKLSWNSVKRVDDNTFSLVGTQAEGNGKYSAVHLGLLVEQNTKGQANFTQVWSEQVMSASRTDGSTEVIYGKFDSALNHNTMVKYFAGDGGTSQLEFWMLDLRNGAPPSKYSTEVPTPKLNFLLAHKLASSDSHDTVVALAGGALSTKPSTWYFTHFVNGTRMTSTVVEPNRGRSQALLSHPNGCLVRLSYGATFPIQQTIQIETVMPTRAENGTVTFAASEKQQYGITWHGLVENDYLLWFVHDVNGDGVLDLVGYCSDASNVFIDVVVFPGLKDGTFGKPVVSPITVDSNIGRLFTAGFMTPLYTTQASYTDPGNEGTTTTGAIMSFFDNYGIIGTRIVAPVGGDSYAYRLAGQDGAIAGQRALTIGSRPAKWMGGTTAAQPVGIVAF